MAKPSAPTSAIAPKPASRKPEAGKLSAGLLVRLAVAACLGASVAMAWQFVWRTTKGEIIGKTGTSDLREDVGGLLRGRSRLEEALRLTPDDPMLKVSLADAMIRYQGTFIKAGDFRSVNFSEFLAARRLLEEVRGVNLRPTVVPERTADMARLMYVAAEQAGDVKLRTEYNTLAANNYIEYRRIAGHPFNDIAHFYLNAVPIFFREGRPDLAVIYAEDLRHLEPDTALTPTYRDALLRSYLQLGEFPAAFALLTEEVLENPAEVGPYSTLLAYASRTGQEKYARHLMESLASDGKLPAEVLPQLEELRRNTAGKAAAEATP